MDRSTATFVDGLGAAAATSGILNQLQGRIFALLYLQPRPIALEDIAAELEQSKSNVSVNIRGLVEWHLVRRMRVAGSRKDHYFKPHPRARVWEEERHRDLPAWSVRRFYRLLIPPIAFLCARGSRRGRTPPAPPGSRT
ncbi:MAG TPA: hypothetical protein VKH65_05185 [Myxococcales bacterium]|nr:hypothetical protein [Myxococcales bacterium]